MVAYLQGSPRAVDDAIIRHLMGIGLSEREATKLVQFVPIAFTRFLYRMRGVQFAPTYVVLDQARQPIDERSIANEPAYGEAWTHCETAAAANSDDEYFILVAGRSGGYRALQDLVQKGSDLSRVITSPPFMFEA